MIHISQKMIPQICPVLVLKSWQNKTIYKICKQLTAHFFLILMTLFILLMLNFITKYFTEKPSPVSNKCIFTKNKIFLMKTPQILHVTKLSNN